MLVGSLWGRTQWARTRHGAKPAATLLIYMRNQKNASRLNGSLTTQMFQSTGTSTTWRGRERQIGESEINNSKHHQQPHLTKVT